MNKGNEFSSETNMNSKQFICEVCKKEFFTKFHYQIHSIVHFVPEYFDCDNCQEGLECILNLDKHLENHNNAMYIICHVCKKEFLDDDSLNEHVKMHNNEFKSAIVLHEESVYENTSIATEIDNEYSVCNDSCSSGEKCALVENTSKDYLQNLFRCESCQKEFHDRNHLEDHFQTNCSILSEHVKTQNSESNTTLILQKGPDIEENFIKTHNKQENTLCQDNSGDICALEENASRDHLQNLFRCKSCKKEFLEKDFDDHYQNHCIKKQLSSNEYELTSTKLISVGNLQMTNNNEPLTFNSLDIIQNVILSENSQVSERVKTFIIQEQEHKSKEEIVCSTSPPKIKKFNCNVCQKVFLNEHSLTIHASSHAKENVFPCHLCEKKFAFNSLLDAHLRTHQRQNFTCGVCQRGYDSKDELFDHIHIHAIVNSYSCDICQKTFSEEISLENHRISHIPKVFTCKVCQKDFFCVKLLSSHVCSDSEPHVNKFFPGSDRVCNICSKAFSKPFYLRQHYRIHTGEKPFKCDLCGACFNQTCSLKKHKLTHQFKKGICKPCSLCPQGYALKSSGNSRFCIHLEKKHFKCKICEKSFASMSGLSYHETIHSGQKPYVCDFCKKAFRLRYYLVGHQRLHIKEKLYKCEFCRICFRQEITLIEHQLTCKNDSTTKKIVQYHQFVHNGIKFYVCDICKKTFSSRRNFNSHRRVHFGEKPYLCEICGKTFARKLSLQFHSHIHLEESPFKCEVCQKGFTSKSVLKSHLVTHTGEKPFMCDLCGRTFTQKHQMKRHLQAIHYNEKPFVCDLCGRRFIEKHLLKHHKRCFPDKNFTKPKTFMCDLCNRGFTQKFSLKRHLQTIHEKESESVNLVLALEKRHHQARTQ